MADRIDERPVPVLDERVGPVGDGDDTDPFGAVAPVTRPSGGSPDEPVVPAAPGPVAAHGPVESPFTSWAPPVALEPLGGPAELQPTDGTPERAAAEPDETPVSAPLLNDPVLDWAAVVTAGAVVAPEARAAPTVPGTAPAPLEEPPAVIDPEVGADPVVVAVPAAVTEPVAPAPAPTPAGAPGPNLWQRWRRRRPRVRKVTRVVRRVDAWSVFKVALVFWAVAYAVVMVAGILLWNLADTTGTIANIEGFVKELFALDSFELQGDVVFRASVWLGAVVAFAGTAATVTAAILFNLITDLVGGIRVTVLEEEVVLAHDSGEPPEAPEVEYEAEPELAADGDVVG